MSARASEWKALLDKALPVLDHVFGPPDERRPTKPQWTLGGGTAIAIQIDHRISYDVDLFVPGTALKEFTPNRNPAAKNISDVYQWPGHYLKFELPEGEIDFLSPPLQTEPGFVWGMYGNRLIGLETPEEVIIKKIRFRSHAFTPRDAYDLAAVAGERHGLARLMAAETSDALSRLKESLRILEAKGQSDLEAYVVLTDKGRTIVSTAFDVARRTVDEAIDLATAPDGPPAKNISNHLTVKGQGIGD